MPLQAGDSAPNFEIYDVEGNLITLAQFRGRKVMLAFFRFAACPFCNLRVHELAAKYPLLKNKIEIIAVFQSPAETLDKHRIAQKLPVHIVPDPAMGLFSLYQGELSWSKFMSAHTLKAHKWIQGVATGAFDGGTTLGELRLAAADFLIDEQGIIHRAHYGRDIADPLPLSVITRFAG